MNSNITFTRLVSATCRHWKIGFSSQSVPSNEQVDFLCNVKIERVGSKKDLAQSTKKLTEIVLSLVREL